MPHGPGRRSRNARRLLDESLDIGFSAAVWQGPPGGLSAGLDVLQHAGLISRRGEDGLAQYLFKHALVRDTAYGSLLREHRAHLHARVATALEALTPQIRSNEPELLARHFTEAGSIEQAVDLWLAAAERANARSACEECLAHVAAALPLARHLPTGKDRELKEVDLQLARARAERALRGESANETGEAYAQARDVGEDLGDPGRLLTALEGCGRFYQHRSRVLGATHDRRAHAGNCQTERRAAHAGAWLRHDRLGTSHDEQVHPCTRKL